MGHSLLNWGSYYHLHLQPVLSDQTTYITLFFLVFLTSTSELILSLWLSWLFLGVFGSSIYFISNPSPIIVERCCRFCPNWKRSKRLCRCKLHYWLVHHCRRQPRHRPHSLYGSFFSLPQNDQKLPKWNRWDVWVNFEGFRMSILILCQLFVIWVQDIFYLGFI